jgi:hypothetical protein
MDSRSRGRGDELGQLGSWAIGQVMKGYGCPARVALLILCFYGTCLLVDFCDFMVFFFFVLCFF